MVEVMQKNWWVLVVRGVAALLFGIAILLSPAGLALTVLVLWWGAYVLVDGVFAVISGIRDRRGWLVVVEGIVGIVAGVLTFLSPGITALALLYVVAAWAIITGVMEIVAAIRLRKEINNEFWLGLSGVISIIFGVLLIASPSDGLLSLLWLVAFYGILFGISMIVLGFRMRNMTSSNDQTHSPQIA